MPTYRGVGSTSVPYRLGFAVKILGSAVPLKEADRRRWQTGPSLERSVELLHGVLDHLDRIGVRVYRLSSNVIPYGSHPDLPQFDYRRQLHRAADSVAELGRRIHAGGIRLSTHPGQYTVINGPDEGLRDRSLTEIEAHAALLDALGCGPDATVVIHVGGLYGDRPSALDRWARAFERLSPAAQARVGIENDERLFSVGDVLALARRTGARVVYDHHHARINSTPGLPAAEALRQCFSTWPLGVRPKVHLSSPRADVGWARRPLPGTRRQRDVAVLPDLAPHADLVSPWDFLELIGLAPAAVDVMLEAKAKDLAVAWLRRQLAAVAPEVGACEERPDAGSADDGIVAAPIAEMERSRRASPSKAVLRGAAPSAE